MQQRQKYKKYEKEVNRYQTRMKRSTLSLPGIQAEKRDYEGEAIFEE